MFLFYTMTVQFQRRLYKYITYYFSSQEYICKQKQIYFNVNKKQNELEYLRRCTQIGILRDSIQQEFSNTHNNMRRIGRKSISCGNVKAQQHIAFILILLRYRCWIIFSSYFLVILYEILITYSRIWFDIEHQQHVILQCFKFDIIMSLQQR